MISRRMLWAVFLILFLVSVMARGEDFENVAAIFQLATGTRSIGMSNTLIALADDENAIFSNPAGLATIKDIRFTSLFSRPFGAFSYGAVGIAVPHFGILGMQLDSGLITTEEGAFRYVSQAATISVGVAAGVFALGARAKIYRLSQPLSGQGWAIDPACLITINRVKIGVIVENLISGDVAFENGHDEHWPTRVNIGVALTMQPFPAAYWNLAVSIADILAAQPQITGGVEVWMEDFAARIGYATNQSTIGLTLRFETYQVDWAYVLHADLPDSHYLSLTFRF